MKVIKEQRIGAGEDEVLLEDSYIVIELDDGSRLQLSDNSSRVRSGNVLEISTCYSPDGPGRGAAEALAVTPYSGNALHIHTVPLTGALESRGKK